MTKQLPVFVYGTLREGFGNYQWALEGKTKKIEKGKLLGEMYSVHGAFPAVLDHGKKQITGELMYVKEEQFEEVLADLDMLEGYDKNNIEKSMYRREIRTITTKTGNVKAYVYIWNGSVSTMRKVVDGDWKKYSTLSYLG